ncbi:MAG: GNAT family N-acetyltransferase [Methanosarcinales archaeon]|jgi:N-acetylglutamate synthase-like GNAT family acetyltransferase|nr:GNAT family N-acetyltransferase [Methanosarcinales archaeon]
MTETKRKSEMVIRRAEKKDETAIEIILSTYFLDRDDIPHDRFYIAEVNGKVVGCAVFEKLQTVESREIFYEIHTIAVMPSYKEKGYGGLLLNRLETEIKKLKTDEKEKSSDEIFTRTTASGFFIHEGFSKSGAEKTKYWNECVRCGKIEICSQTVLSKKI